MASDQWYVAEIVLQINVQDDPRIVVWTNFVLIRGDSAEEAFANATRHGYESESCYENSEGKLVSFQFRGLHALHPVEGALEHGIELLFEQVEMRPEELDRWISPKKDLEPFRTTICPTTEPALISRSLVERLRKDLPNSRLAKLDGFDIL